MTNLTFAPNRGLIMVAPVGTSSDAVSVDDETTITGLIDFEPLGILSDSNPVSIGAPPRETTKISGWQNDVVVRRLTTPGQTWEISVSAIEESDIAMELWAGSDVVTAEGNIGSGVVRRAVVIYAVDETFGDVVGTETKVHLYRGTATITVTSSRDFKKGAISSLDFKFAFDSDVDGNFAQARVAVQTPPLP